MMKIFYRAFMAASAITLVALSSANADPVILTFPYMVATFNSSNSLDSASATSDTYNSMYDGVYVAHAVEDPFGDGALPVGGESALARVVLGTLPFAGPSVFAAVATDPDDPASGASATAVLSYEMEVLGADDLTVPVLMHALLFAAQSAPGFSSAGAGASLGIVQGFNSWGWNVCSSSGGDCIEKPLDGFVNNIDFATNLPITVTMEVGAGGEFGGGSQALADPYFEIDPTFLAEHPDLKIILSPLVGNNPPRVSAPEPLTISIFVAGLLGMSVRRRRSV